MKRRFNIDQLSFFPIGWWVKEANLAPYCSNCHCPAKIKFPNGFDTASSCYFCGADMV